MQEKELLLKQYSSLMLVYVKYKNYMENIIENLLIKNGIKYQALTSRIKGYESLSNKLDNINLIKELAGDIKNINDFCGIRIILYDNENLNKMKHVIECNFEIVDYKNKKLEYNANNITVKLKDDVYKDYRCEIQLVTTMSHNLIEIGHDIVYKDTMHLEEMDSSEYKLITDEYNSCLEDVYKMETRIENIKRRAQNICYKFKLYETIISDRYIKGIEKNDSLSRFYSLCNDIESLVPFLSRNSEKAQVFFDKMIITKLTKNISKLNDDGIYTKEFVFDNYVKLLSPYSHIWIYDLDSVFGILIPYLSIENNARMNKSFSEMIKNIITDDIKNNKWIIFRKIKDWIMSGTEYPNYRMKLANCIITNNISYAEEVDVLKLSLITKQISYNENGRKMIIELFNYCCNLFKHNQNKIIFDELINFTYKFQFLYNEILNFFYENYDAINKIYKFDLVRRIYYSFKEEMPSEKFYKKVKSEKTYDIYRYLVYEYFDEDVEKKDWNKIQIKSKSVISNYIKNINSKDYDEILQLLECYELLIKESDYVLIKFEEFLCNIGSNYKFVNKLYRKSKNPYLYLGMEKASKKVATRYDIALIRALQRVFIKDVFLDVLKNRKNNKEKDTIICSIILDERSNLYCNKKVRNSLLEIVKHYNLQKRCIINSYISQDIIETLTPIECDIILDNYKYDLQNINNFFDINMMNIFNVYPQNVRNYIKSLIISKNKDNLKYSLKMNLSSCNNYSIERKNNILLILEMLKKYEYFEIYKYVDDLVEKQDKEIIIDLMNIINDDDSSEMLLAISKFMCETDLGLSAWNVARIILLKTDEKIINDNIFVSLIGVGVVSSLSEAYSNNIIELKKLKKNEENEKLKDYLDNLIRFFKTNIGTEKLTELNRKNEMELDFRLKSKVKNMKNEEEN